MWGQIAAAGIGAAGGLLGGGGSENIGPGDMIPKWAKQDWMDTGANIKNLQDPTSYAGPWTAQQNPMWQQSLQGMSQYGQPGGFGNAAQNFMGMQGANAMNQGMNGLQGYMNQLQQQGPQQFQYDQGTYDTTMQNLMPGLQGSFDAAMRDPQRQFQEQTLPGINMGSIGAGSSFGTKSFNQGAIANRGLQDRAADTAAGLYANAANQANANAYGAGGLNMQSGQNLQNNLLSNYGNMAQIGGNWLGQGYDMGRQNLAMQNQAGMQQQGYDQQFIDRQREQWNEQQNLPWQAQQNRQNLYAGLSGGTNQGGVNTGFSNVLNGIQAGLGVYGMGQDAGWWGK